MTTYSQLIPVDLYRDSTRLYSDEECDAFNCETFMIREHIVRAWYDENIAGEELDEDFGVYENTFENWYRFVYTCDDVDGLYHFAVDRGFTPIATGYLM